MSADARVRYIARTHCHCRRHELDVRGAHELDVRGANELDVLNELKGKKANKKSPKTCQRCTGELDALKYFKNLKKTEPARGAHELDVLPRY